MILQPGVHSTNYEILDKIKIITNYKSIITFIICGLEKGRFELDVSSQQRSVIMESGVHHRSPYTGA